MASRPKRSDRENRPSFTVLAFLLPNLVGFLVFTLFPVALSLWMAFTNWTVKPSVPIEYIGLRNFTDLLGVRATDRGAPGVEWGFVAAAAVLVAGLTGALWANVGRWSGTKAGGLLLGALGVGILVTAARGGGGQAAFIAGALLTAGGIAMAAQDGAWAPGVGTVPAVAVTVAVVVLWRLSPAMWRLYEPADLRFWQYFYNTLYLMLGIPFSIAGSLGLALLLNDSLPLGRRRVRLIGAALCVVCGLVTMGVVWSLGSRDAALMGAVLWGIAAVGFASDVVAFRTIFYVPTFTAGVALMILWKALYNPQTGPIDAGLAALFHATGLNMKPPEWLTSVDWAKPALILMGVWTSIGGTNMLLYLAGLSNVPPELVDAARVDGAGGWNRFRHVVWPQLAPTTFFISTMAIIGGLQGGFEQARVMTQGGPAGSTTTLNYYIYNKAFQDLDLGYAAAISWVLFGLIFVATALHWKFGRDLEAEA